MAYNSVEELVWSDELNTDIGCLDKQHKELAYHLEGLKLYLKTGHPADVIVMTYRKMIDEIKLHFEFEERIMRNISFSGYSGHSKSHQYMLHKLVDIDQRVLSKGNIEEIGSAIEFLETVLSDHLTKEDIKVRDFLLR